ASIAPSAGPVGTSVTISGTNLASATGVAFHGAAATFTVVSATSLKATVPAAATTGTIQVTNPAGTATSATLFRVSPRISSFSPASGLAGVKVTVIGDHLSGVTSAKLGAIAATFTQVSGTSIT